jgi:hypothetical protein
MHNWYGSENSGRVTLSLICLAESVRNIDEFMSDALIFDLAPCKAGKNEECKSAGFG